MKKWTRAPNYGGADWTGWSVGLGQNRDSDCVEQSNFRVFLQTLEEADPTGESVAHVRENHWAVGWVEWVGIAPDAPPALLELAESMMRQLEDYPVLDEEDLSELELDEQDEAWGWMSPADRLAFIRRYRCPHASGVVSLLKAVRDGDLWHAGQWVTDLGGLIR